MESLHALDYVVLAVYLLVVVAIAARVTRASPDADDLFLAGRTLGVGVVGFSLFASNISSTTLIGLPGAAWATGISVANYEWMAALVLAFTAVFIAPMLLEARVTTIPELLGRRYSPAMRRYLSAVTLFLSLVLDTAGSLYAGALVLKLFFPALTLGPTCAAIAIFAGLYTAAGGLRAVAYTDVIQAVVLLCGSLLLTVLVFGEFDYSWSAVVAQVDPDKLSLLRPMDDPALPWLGTLIGLPILGFYYWTINQYVSQRLLGARDARTAGRGALLAAWLKLLPLFLMVIPGVMATVLYTDLERPDTVFPRLVADFAPIGVSGLILAGLLAAIMSSVDSTLNSASTLIIVDFVQPRRPQLQTHQLARLGRICIFVLVALAAIWAPMIDRFPGLFAYLQQTFAYVTPPLVAVFLLGLYTRLGARAALYGTLTGHAISAMAFVGDLVDWHQIHFTIVAGLLFAVSIVACGLWQAVLGGRDVVGDEQLAARVRGAGVVATADVRLGATVLAAVTALMVWLFR
ncbi:MAG: sodium/solute symporter [Pseudomonadota bacterium]